ncbi:helix-turn-helix domain-containing protein [Bradyrhizobium sp. SRL28]|uniref:helix-turn-helix domain-containing protein n=1 Tax=Bradyrhizobium sp. SRL28 TaxID=2836178 RepID=UPI001BDE617C|nr:helix-turn-helix domain-containing protein [Bradyrhizobium sp. SRL28]MBT1509471.1 helix-turn-helix domain-containing protein [Bradyrhizobium sp. SRL28]
MIATPQIPLAIPDGRRALAQMYIDLTMAFHASIYPPGKVPSEPDCHLTLVAVAVMLGHAEGHPMNATEVASRVQMPRSSVLTRLNALIGYGLVERIEDRFYIERDHAANVPHRDQFELILSQAFAVLGPLLSKSDE